MASAPTAGELRRMSIPALFAGARAEVAEDDRDGPFPYLVALHLRPTREVFDTAAQLLSHDDLAARELGARVLRELGPAAETGRRAFTAEAGTAAGPPARSRTGTKGPGRVISALGYNSARDALNAVLPFAAHPHRVVRFHVAAALPALVDPNQVEPAASQAMQRLCRDEDADTRFYALYALVEELPGADQAQVNQILVDCLDDPGEAIRSYVRDHHVSHH